MHAPALIFCGHLWRIISVVFLDVLKFSVLNQPGVVWWLAAPPPQKKKKDKKERAMESEWGATSSVKIDVSAI